MMHFFCLTEVEYCRPEPKWKRIAPASFARGANGAGPGSGADRFMLAQFWTQEGGTLFTNVCERSVGFTLPHHMIKGCMFAQRKTSRLQHYLSNAAMPRSNSRSEKPQTKAMAINIS
jgi:hypothetical protein